MAARRLPTHLRYEGVTIECGVKRTTFSIPIWMLRDLVDSLENSDVVRADAHLNDPHKRPVTGTDWPRQVSLTKVNLPRETLDE